MKVEESAYNIVLWISQFAAMRAKDDSKTFARVNRAALREISERAEQARAILALSPAWLPISSAPKDGTEIIVAVPRAEGGWIVAAAHWVPHDDRVGDWWWANESSGDYYAEPISMAHAAPTHWSPLPPPPTSSGEMNMSDANAHHDLSPGASSAPHQHAHDPKVYEQLGRACEANGLGWVGGDGEFRFQPPADYIAEKAVEEFCVGPLLDTLRPFAEAYDACAATLGADWLPDDATVLRGGLNVPVIDKAIRWRDLRQASAMWARYGHSQASERSEVGSTQGQTGPGTKNNPGEKQ